MTDATTALAHDTIRLERELPHSPARVFAAYADIDERVAWSAPTDDEIVIFESHDFRVGGTDRFICGPREAPTFAGTTRYEHIEPDRLLVFTERLVTTEEVLLAISLASWQFDAMDDGCRLTIIDQVTSVAGDGPIEGSRHGYGAILDQLARHLGSAS